MTLSAITVDGYTSDWAGLNSFGSDPNDVPDYTGQVDLRSIAMADDYSNLYVTLRNDALIGSLNWGYGIYLDTDNNPGTGYRGALGSLSIGAGYMIQGSSLYIYQGTGMDWSWLFQTTLTTAVNGANAEYLIPKLELGKPSLFKLIFYGDNAVNSPATYIDLFPDQAMTAGQALTYQANAATSSSLVDLIAPELTVPTDMNVAGTGALTPATLSPAVAYDQVDGYVQVYNNAPSLFPVGTTIVNYTAVDNSGNVASGRQLVTVTVYVDTISPTVTSPVDITIQAVSVAGVPVTDAQITTFLAGVTASDNMAVVGPVTNNAPAIFPIGITTVSFVAVDAAGNSGSAQATVTVLSPPAVLTSSGSGGGGGCLIQTGDGNGWFLALMLLSLLRAINYFRSRDEHRRVE